ncbi:hypothetical protein CGCF415_v000550 [Colletotrichum fructicola]|nr:hypothetical protein CGCF415_v000550 [Colletotrichum fructicola]KAF4940331.1 hypothetical protein CGCF245_v002712 [Colletotrichum fructicola]KAF5495959.1 hypothetical protein CGCF413_v008584 [Colletotrichum fructicola]
MSVHSAPDSDQQISPSFRVFSRQPGNERETQKTKTRRSQRGSSRVDQGSDHISNLKTAETVSHEKGRSVESRREEGGTKANTTATRTTRAERSIEERRLVHSQRRLLKESGDYLGVQGFNPDTGELDIITPSTSSSATWALDPKLASFQKTQRKPLDGRRGATVLTEKDTRSVLDREKERFARKDREKEELRRAQEKIHWNRNRQQWSSAQEPNLSPIAQSSAGMSNHGSDRKDEQPMPQPQRVQELLEPVRRSPPRPLVPSGPPGPSGLKSHLPKHVLIDDDAGSSDTVLHGEGSNHPFPGARQLRGNEISVGLINAERPLPALPREDQRQKSGVPELHITPPSAYPRPRSSTQTTRPGGFSSVPITDSFLGQRRPGPVKPADEQVPLDASSQTAPSSVEKNVSPGHNPLGILYQKHSRPTVPAIDTQITSEGKHADKVSAKPLSTKNGEARLNYLQSWEQQGDLKKEWDPLESCELADLSLQQETEGRAHITAVNPSDSRMNKVPSPTNEATATSSRLKLWSIYQSHPASPKAMSREERVEASVRDLLDNHHGMTEFKSAQENQFLTTQVRLQGDSATEVHPVWAANQKKADVMADAALTPITTTTGFDQSLGTPSQCRRPTNLEETPENDNWSVVAHRHSSRRFSDQMSTSTEDISTTSIHYRFDSQAQVLQKDLPTMSLRYQHKSPTPAPRENTALQCQFDGPAESMTEEAPTSSARHQGASQIMAREKAVGPVCYRPSERTYKIKTDRPSRPDRHQSSLPVMKSRKDGPRLLGSSRASNPTPSPREEGQTASVRYRLGFQGLSQDLASTDHGFKKTLRGPATQQAAAKSSVSSSPTSDSPQANSTDSSVTSLTSTSMSHPNELKEAAQDNLNQTLCLEAARTAMVESGNKMVETLRDHRLNKDSNSKTSGLRNLPVDGVLRARLRNGLHLVRTANKSKAIWKDIMSNGAVSDMVKDAKTLGLETRGDCNMSGAVLNSNDMRAAKTETVKNRTLLQSDGANDVDYTYQLKTDQHEADVIKQKEVNNSSQKQQQILIDQTRPANVNPKKACDSNQKEACNTPKTTQLRSPVNQADPAMLKTGCSMSTAHEVDKSEDGVIEGRLRREEWHRQTRKYATQGKQLAISLVQLYWEVISPCFVPTSPLRQRLDSSKSTWTDVGILVLALIGGFMLLAVAIRLSQGIAWMMRMMRSILGI